MAGEFQAGGTHSVVWGCTYPVPEPLVVGKGRADVYNAMLGGARVEQTVLSPPNCERPGTLRIDQQRFCIRHFDMAGLTSFEVPMRVPGKPVGMTPVRYLMMRVAGDCRIEADRP